MNQQTRNQHNRSGFSTSLLPCPDHQLPTVPSLNSTVVLTAGPGVTSTEARLERHHGTPLTKKSMRRREKKKRGQKGKKKKRIKKNTNKKQKMTLMGKRYFFKKIHCGRGENPITNC